MADVTSLGMSYYRVRLPHTGDMTYLGAMTTTPAPATISPTCPECGDPVVFDGGLYHCETDGAWDRAGLLWVDASGAIVDDPSEYSRRAAAARR